MKANLPAKIYIGTSGWSYKDWTGNFYPEKTKPVDFLKYYSQQFRTVEINNSFYHALKDETVVHWREEVPDDFIFSVKAERYITHTKKLEEPEKTIPGFIQSLNSFNNKLGPILFQLPPSFGFNAERLKSFVKFLPEKKLYVMEFRNKTWFNDETYEILKENNIALCIFNLKDYETPWVVTSDFSYARFHGTKGIGLGKYNKEDIDNFAENIKKIASDNKKVFCYFNNDVNGSAISNSMELIKAIQK